MPSEQGITVSYAEDGKTPQQVRYLTDDRDSRRPLELVIGWGGNGDWYVYTAPQGEVSFNAVRLCTSGGISSRVPGVNPLVARIFNLLVEAITRAPVPTEPATVNSNRNNYEDREDGKYVCYGNHPSSADCEWVKVEPAPAPVAEPPRYDPIPDWPDDEPQSPRVCGECGHFGRLSLGVCQVPILIELEEVPCSCHCTFPQVAG